MYLSMISLLILLGWPRERYQVQKSDHRVYVNLHVYMKFTWWFSHVVTLPVHLSMIWEQISLLISSKWLRHQYC